MYHLTYNFVDVKRSLTMLKICLVCRNKVAMVFFLYMLHCISSLMWLMKKLFSLLSFNAHLCHLDKKIDLFCHHYVMQILASKINPQGRHSFAVLCIYIISNCFCFLSSLHFGSDLLLLPISCSFRTWTSCSTELH